MSRWSYEALQDAVYERPLCEAIWREFTNGFDHGTPEGRTEMDEAMQAFLATIEHEVLRAHYESFLKARRTILFATWAMPEVAL